MGVERGRGVEQGVCVVEVRGAGVAPLLLVPQLAVQRT